MKSNTSMHCRPMLECLQCPLTITNKLWDRFFVSQCIASLLFTFFNNDKNTFNNSNYNNNSLSAKSANCNFDISSYLMFSGLDCLLWEKKTLSLMCSHEQNMWYSLEILTCIHCDYCYVFIFLFLQKEKNWWFICLTGQMFFIQCCFPMHCRPTSKINK